VVRSHLHGEKPRPPDEKLKLRSEKLKPRGERVDLHREKVDPHCEKLKLHREKVDLHCEKLDLHREKTDLHRVFCPPPDSQSAKLLSKPQLSSQIGKFLAKCRAGGSFSIFHFPSWKPGTLSHLYIVEDGPFVNN
jgi:hypothetical protein